MQTTFFQIAILFCSFFTAGSSLFASHGGTIILPQGTTVSVELNQTVNSEDMEIGHTLEFTVVSDVVVNRVVVIRAGSVAEGRVTNVKKTCNGYACDNTCAAITIEVNNVTTIDGSRVNLSATPHTVRGKAYGTYGAQINLTKRLTARTRNDATLLL